MNNVDTYKIYRQLEERQKRRNSFQFYDRDELVDEILKNEDEIERLNNIINELEKWAKGKLEHPDWASCGARCMLDKLQELKEKQ